MNYQVCDPLTQEEYEALKASIAKTGVEVPVVMDENGDILDGHHRMRAYYELKAAGVDIPPPAKDIRRGLSETDKRNLARTLNAVRRQMTKDQRNKLIVAMREDGMSYRQIGEAVGVDPATAHRTVANATVEQPSTITGRDGKERPATMPRPEPAPLTPAMRTYNSGLPVLDLPGSPETSAQREPKLEQAPPGSRLAVHHSSETPEHYTPSAIVDAVVKLLGNIDLDPCSNSHDAPNVPAVAHYTKDDDGLQQFWDGRVYLNPPYGRGIDLWIGKLLEAYAARNVVEAVALLPARPDTQWWQLLRDHPCCFVTGRLTFVGNDDPAPFPSALFYLGERHDDFYREFSRFGDIWIRLDEHWFTE